MLLVVGNCCFYCDLCTFIVVQCIVHYCYLCIIVSCVSWYVHYYCKLCITGNWLHLLSVILHHVSLVLLMICASLLVCSMLFTSWCGLCIIVSCALQATGSTCSVASARRGGSGVTRREYAPPPGHLSYKEFPKEKNAECLHFRFSWIFNKVTHTQHCHCHCHLHCLCQYLSVNVWEWVWWCCCSWTLMNIRAGWWNRWCWWW